MCDIIPSIMHGSGDKLGCHSARTTLLGLPAYSLLGAQSQNACLVGNCAFKNASEADMCAMLAGLPLNR